MYTNIVVGTDGSETAQEAVRHAKDLAKLSGATLHVVTAYRAPTATGIAAFGSDAMPIAAVDVMEEAREELAKQVESMLERIATDLQKEDVAAKTYVSAEDPAEAIIATAEQENADLIVVGNRGMSGLQRLVLGSVSNKVSHHAPCSVLIVHTT